MHSSFSSGGQGLTLVRILLGVILAILRALTGAFAALFSSLALGVVTLLVIAVLGFALFSFLGIGFARKRGRD